MDTASFWAKWAPADAIFALLLVGGMAGVLLAGLAALVLHHRREQFRLRLRLAEAELKADMVRRGMGAEEIHRIIAVTTAPEPSPGSPAAAARPLGPAGQLAVDMAGRGADSDGIVQLLQSRGLGPGEDAEAAADAAIQAMQKVGYDADAISDVVLAIRGLAAEAGATRAAEAVSA